MSQYAPPAWSAPPTVLYSLEVLKDGISLDEIPLSPKPFYLLGRDDSCDISLAHPSASRFHAVLQHHTAGSLHLYDLGSTHGSFLNGSMVKPHCFERLYTGDVVKFAGSTRTYVIEGPENQQREDKMFSEDGHLLVQPSNTKRPSQLQVNIREIEAQRKRQLEYEAEVRARLQEVSWGLGEDAKEAAINPQDKILYEDVLDLEQVKMRGDVTEKHLRQISLIETKRVKLDRLTREAGNIQRKEEDQEKGLTSGQSRRLAETTQRMADLKEEIALEEENLRDLFLEPQGQKPMKLAESDSDSDEYFDRVKKIPKKQAESGLIVESYEAGLAEYQDLAQARDLAVSHLTAIDTGKDIAEEDEFEAFMRENRREVEKEGREKAQIEIKRMNERVEKLHEALGRLDGERFSRDLRQEERREETASREKQEIEQISAQKEEKPLLSVPTIPEKFQVTPKPPSRNVPEDFSVSREELEVACGSAEVSEGRKRAVAAAVQWQPPKGQTGDGRTALNEKFRY